MYNFTFPGHVFTLLGQVKVKMLEILAVLASPREFIFSAILWRWANLGFGSESRVG